MTCLLLPCPPHVTDVTVIVTWRYHAHNFARCQQRIPMSGGNSLRTTKKAQNWCCSNLLFSGCEMFDLGTVQRPVLLKTSGWFCRRAPTSCEQFPASSRSPGRCRRHGVRFRRMCITLVSGMPGGIRYCITNNGGYICNLKLLAIAVFFSKQARKRCSRNFFPPCKKQRSPNKKISFFGLCFFMNNF